MSTFEEFAYMSMKKELSKWETSKYLEKEKVQNILWFISLFYLLITRIIKQEEHFHVPLPVEGRFGLEDANFFFINEKISALMH